MDTLVIKLTNKDVIRLIRELEDLNLLKVMEVYHEKESGKASNYAGHISPEVAEKMHTYVSKQRKDWE